MHLIGKALPHLTGSELNHRLRGRVTPGYILGGKRESCRQVLYQTLCKKLNFEKSESVTELM